MAATRLIVRRFKRNEQREADKYVKKDNIWRKPDYQAMIDGGVPFDVVYFIKKARDSLNASPQYYRTDDTPEKRLACQKQYIETVRQVQAVMEDVRTRARRHARI